MAFDQWKCPPEAASEDAKLGWLNSAIQQGQAFLQNQPAYREINRARQQIEGKDMDMSNKTRSQMSDNLLGRDTREYIASLSNMRPVWEYKSYNPDYQHNVAMLNKLLLAWWNKTFADRKIREGLQYAGVDGTGYIMPLWDRAHIWAKEGDVALHALGADQVLPIQIGKDNDLQRAYAVVIRVPTPIHIAHTLYPQFADRLVPDRNGPSLMAKGLQFVQKFVAPALRVGGAADNASKSGAYFPEVDIFHVYILDPSINVSGKTVAMGDPGTSWYYEVPTLGSDIDTGMEAADGTPITRKAMPEDCMLYPNRRCILASRTCQIYDGTSKWWHGQVPVVPFKLNDWAWNYLGYSLMHDCFSLDAGINRIQRGISDSVDLRLDPPKSYDKANVARSVMEKMDFRRPGMALGVNSTMGAGKGIESLFDPRQYDVPQWVAEFVQTLKTDQKNILGVADVTALIKARQIPSSDSIEKLLEMAGPIVTDSTRNMERSMCMLGDMLKSLFFQFKTIEQRLQIMGDDGITAEDFDYKPGEMTPSHMKGEDTAIPSRFSASARAQFFSNQFYMFVTPNSLTQITQMSRKLLYLQLYRSGFPIDPWTVGE